MHDFFFVIDFRKQTSLLIFIHFSLLFEVDYVKNSTNGFGYQGSGQTKNKGPLHD